MNRSQKIYGRLPSRRSDFEGWGCRAKQIDRGTREANLPFCCVRAAEAAACSSAYFFSFPFVLQRKQK
jgi:hypothetical protein